jgi:hypothetical protein
MKTAVEWLIERHFGSIENCSPNFRNHIEQANKMFEEQIIKHSLELAKILISNPIEVSGKTPQELFEQYYNETFKSE